MQISQLVFFLKYLTIALMIYISYLKTTQDGKVLQGHCIEYVFDIRLNHISIYPVM